MKFINPKVVSSDRVVGRESFLSVEIENFPNQIPTPWSFLSLPKRQGDPEHLLVWREYQGIVEKMLVIVGIFSGAMLGFGGRRFELTLTDGRTVVSNNCWDSSIYFLNAINKEFQTVEVMQTTITQNSVRVRELFLTLDKAKELLPEGYSYVKCLPYDSQDIMWRVQKDV